jgi:hypothetical protein
VTFHWETKKLIKTAIDRGIYKAVKVKGSSGKGKGLAIDSSHR